MTLAHAIRDLVDVVQRVKESARADGLTPLLNGAALSEDSEEFGNEFVALAFGDLNRFKAINDTHGHDAGDAAIHAVGARLHLIAEEHSAAAYRQSGDEFVILFRTQTDAANFGKQLSAMPELSVTFEGRSFPVSISFGVHTVGGGIEVGEFGETRARAEQACQAAKMESQIWRVWAASDAATSSVSLRARCKKCGTTIACQVPSNLNVRTLSVCPNCREELPK